MKQLALLSCILSLLIITGCKTNRTITKETGFIPMGDTRIYYESAGEGDALLLVHAGFQDVVMWSAQVPELSKRYRVITIDVPGHGRTQNDTIRSYPADFIRTVLDSLHISKASVAGVSLGASCVTDFVLAHPERVNKVILVAAGVNGWDRKFKLDSVVIAYFESFFAALEKKDTTGAAELFTKFWCDGPKRTPQQVQDTIRNYVYQTTLANMQQHKIRGWPVLAEPPAIERLHQWQPPLLIIDGDQDVPYIHEACSYIQSTVPGSKRISIPNTGHMLNMEDPKAFNKAVLDFLRQP
ncbi:MAG TPA: alpha/beta hydrolase [Chitinophagaceae bacterium]|nr:alpha/beta hydrolase [Chitinophagaceae bacterium]